MFGFNSAEMIFAIPALLIALTIHEYAHGRMAYALGDNTAKLMGRLTLNPIPHLDPIGLIMLFFFKFGWAKPVPINPNNFTNYRKGTLLVSFAGPASNILMAITAFVIMQVLQKLGLLTHGWQMFFSMLYIYNIFFAVFNMIPVPPLDGSKILVSLFPQLEGEVYYNLERYGMFIIMGLAITGIIGTIIKPVYAVMTTTLTVILQFIMY